MNTEDAKAFIDLTASRLSHVERVGPFSFITMPLSLPNGTGIVVRVESRETGYLVSDYGQGYNEADILGMDQEYLKAAELISKSANIRFKEKSFLLDEIGTDQLYGAISAIASCTFEAMVRAIQIEENL